MSSVPETVALEVTDPVCGMQFHRDDAVGHVEYRGQTYYVCSESCLERFQLEPEKFVAPGPMATAPPYVQ